MPLVLALSINDDGIGKSFGHIMPQSLGTDGTTLGVAACCGRDVMKLKNYINISVKVVLQGGKVVMSRDQTQVLSSKF